MNRRKALILGASAFVAMALPVVGATPLTVSRALAAQAEIYTGLVKGVAVGGYDPVTYFSVGEPVEGSADLTHIYKGAEWRFSTPENRDTFAANPERYAPQYGGHCAWALAQGYLAKGDPKHWRIVDGQLYLNYNRRIHRRWERDIPGFIASGDDNWPSVLN